MYLVEGSGGRPKNKHTGFQKITSPQHIQYYEMNNDEGKSED